MGLAPERSLLSRAASHPLILASAIGLVIALLDFLWTVVALPVRSPILILFDFCIVTYLVRAVFCFQRRLRFAAVVTGIVVLAAMAAEIVKFELLRSEPSIGDLLLIDDLLIFYGWGSTILVLAGPVILFGLLLFNARLPKPADFPVLVPALAAVLIFATKMLAPALIAGVIPPMQASYHWFPTQAIFGTWGTFGLNTVRFADRRALAAELRAQLGPGDHVDFLTAKAVPLQPRNVYIVLIESLLDPHTVPGASYDASPLQGAFAEWKSRGLGYAASPVFGGRSPDAEFELLCGLPAITDSSQIVFSELTAETINCLPRQLTQAGWATHATVPVDPHLFEARAAYQRLGFDDWRFSDDLDWSDRDGGTMASGALLDQVLASVGAHAGDGRPQLHYVFLTAGHFPFERDRSKRPDRINGIPADPMLTAMANAVYYNTTAVSAYIDQVRKLDPSGIIVTLGDHEPPLTLTAPGLSYPGPMEERYRVPLVIIDGQRGMIDLGHVAPTYQLPFVILDLLSGGQFCKINSCPHLQRYAARPTNEALILYDSTDGSAQVCSEATAPCAAAQHDLDALKSHLLSLIGF